jgi:N-acetylglutamate synthase-like GNAT family acetyltransferase
MTSPALNVRRATVDDLATLRSIWLNAQMPADELESRLTEFHVVEAGGQVAGALGVQVVRQHARLHSEDYLDFAVADAARELFWDRIQTLAANLGVFRVWTQETSPFWSHWGFLPANPETLTRLPEEWKDLPGRWLTMALKDEDAINQVIQSQLAGLADAEKQQAARVARQARMMNIVGAAIFFFAAAILFVIAGYLWHRTHAP